MNVVLLNKEMCILAVEREQKAVVVISTDQKVLVDGLVTEGADGVRAEAPGEAEVEVDSTGVVNGTLSVTVAVTKRKGYN